MCVECSPPTASVVVFFASTFACSFVSPNASVADLANLARCAGIGASRAVFFVSVCCGVALFTAASAAACCFLNSF